jgi:hypothetical protein
MISSMYRKVTSENDFKIFYDTLIPSWLEMKYDLECVLGKVDRYIVFNDEKIPVGTVEIIPYKEKSYLDTFFPFNENEVVKKNVEKIVEVEALSIHPEFRGENNLERIIYTLIEHGRLNNINLGIGLINPILYLALKNTYKVPIKRVGKLVNRNNFKVYPFIIDARYIYENIEKFQWLYRLYELDNNLAREALYSTAQLSIISHT